MAKKYRKEFEALTKMHDAMARAAERLQNEYNKLREEHMILENQNTNLEKALHINKDILRNQITQDNEKEQSNAQEVKLLKAKIKELEG